MAVTVQEMDLSGLTAGEMIELGQALGCSTAKETQAKMQQLAEMAGKGDVPLEAIIPFLWLAAKQSRPGLTLAQARNIPFSEVSAILPTPPAATAPKKRPSPKR